MYYLEKNDYILMDNTGILIQIGSKVEPVTAAALFKMVTLLFLAPTSIIALTILSHVILLLLGNRAPS